MCDLDTRTHLERRYGKNPDLQHEGIRKYIKPIVSLVLYDVLESVEMSLQMIVNYIHCRPLVPYAFSPADSNKVFNKVAGILSDLQRSSYSCSGQVCT